MNGKIIRSIICLALAACGLASERAVYATRESVDVLATGLSGLPEMIAPAGFEDSGVSLLGGCRGSLDWGDFENDGDLDILISGYVSYGQKYPIVTKIYRNENGNFEEIQTSIIQLFDGATAWGDFDNDSDLDILITGYDGTTTYSKLYRNDGQTGESGWIFTDMNAKFVNVGAGSLDWGDYDNDGDLDILLTGLSSTVPITKIYRNDGASINSGWQFTDTNAAVDGVMKSGAAWGDYDNDSDLV